MSGKENGIRNKQEKARADGLASFGGVKRHCFKELFLFAMLLLKS